MATGDGRYITWNDVTDRYKRVPGTNDAQTTGAVFIPQAEAEVDGRLAPRYAVPFTAPIPEIVRDLSIDLVYYKMIMLDPKKAAELGKSLAQRFKDILAGAIIIPVGGDSSPGNAASLDKAYTSAFGHDDPASWRPDRDAIDDDRAARDPPDPVECCP